MIVDFVILSNAISMKDTDFLYLQSVVFVKLRCSGFSMVLKFDLYEQRQFLMFAKLCFRVLDNWCIVVAIN